MIRKLKYHEQKLLKKVDFLEWKSTNNIREIQVINKFHITRREDYTKYNKLRSQIISLTEKLALLDSKDPVRHETETALVAKLYNMGLINHKSSLSSVDRLTVTSFCRRRLPVIMCKLRMAETIEKATEYITHGHVRVGVDRVMDPAFLVTRTLEDYVTWVDTSKIKRQIMKYNDKLDDYDLL